MCTIIGGLNVGDFIQKSANRQSLLLANISSYTVSLIAILFLMDLDLASNIAMQLAIVELGKVNKFEGLSFVCMFSELVDTPLSTSPPCQFHPLLDTYIPFFQKSYINVILQAIINGLHMIKLVQLCNSQICRPITKALFVAVLSERTSLWFVWLMNAFLL